MQRVMRDSALNEAERRLQPPFSKSSIFSGLALAALILLAHALMIATRSLRAMAPRELALRIEPAQLDAERFSLLRLAGAWRLSAADPRFGGVSALAIDGEGFVALSDSGSVLRFGRPGDVPLRVSISSLPGGPGPANRKIGRDSESLARAVDGGGWWVGFEQIHAAFRFDSSLSRVLERVDLGAGWRDNKGVEAMAAPGDGRLLMFPEAGDTMVELHGGRLRESPLRGAGAISDAALLPDGRAVVLLRSVTPLGLSNALAIVEHDGRGYRLSRPLQLPIGAFDNGEALAVEPLPEGAVRLWLMTDNDFRPSVRTLLVAIDVPRGALDER